MRRVAVVGVGCTRVGEIWDKSLKDLATESSLKAVDGSGVNRVDAIYVANASAPVLQGQGNLGVLVSDSLGINGVPAISVEAASASGGLAFHEAVNAVSSGRHDFVLVTGVEKMSDAPPSQAVKALMASEDQEYVAFTGISPSGLQAMVLRLYMEKFNVKHEQVAAFAVNGYENSVNNPYAQFHVHVTVDDVLKSPLVADPLRLLEYAGMSDGSASVVLGPLDTAKKLSDTPVEVLASAVAADWLILPERDDMLSFKATRGATERAFKEAGVTVDDVDVVETHDLSAIMGIISLEDLGFVEKGMGASLVAEGGIALNGRLPTNTMGGLRGRGNPVGASGIYQLVELVWQLRGEAGKNQVKDVEVGLAHNVGGTGSVAAVSILRRG